MVQIKNIIWLLIGLVMLFCVVTVTNLWLLDSDPPPPVAADELTVDAQQAAARLAQALRIATIANLPEPQRSENFLRLRRLLQTLYPAVHRHLHRELINEHSMLLRWDGLDPRKPPILFAAHQDVVPIEEDSRAAWLVAPFAGKIHNGFIWGRGALDYKSGLMGMLEAVTALLADGFQPQRTLYLAFGHDEERGGREGAAMIAQYLQDQGIKLDFVMDEGMMVTQGILPQLAEPVALIGVAEKGFVSVELSVDTEGGHASIPPTQTAIGLLAVAIARLEQRPMSTKLGSPTTDMLRYLGPYMPLLDRFVLSNQWLFAPLIEQGLARAPATNALVRTTTAVTLFQSGVQENVLPRSARALVNFRILPGERVEQVVAHVRDTIADPRVNIRIDTREQQPPSVVSSLSSYGYSQINKTIRQIFPTARVAPALVVGATDARFYQPLSADVYRFHPVLVLKQDLDRFHGVNERISVQGYARLVRFYVQLLRNLES